MIVTERLVLRPYREEDRGDFAALNGHPQVGAWLAGVLDRPQSDAMLDRINAHIDAHGFGFWGMARREDDRIIGFCGLSKVEADALPVGPCIEMGWRMIPSAWGQGYATEAAQAAMDWAWANLDADELVAFTARTNLASQGVMRRIGMQPDPSRDFEHPRLAADHPLRSHVLYARRRPA